ncbi:membrane dipeptidase [Brevundimonas sp.]|uniref:dipeptidase n=1 Tax=Brevundimonas sp. TaxID=1871086 RepID=UPI00248A7BAE|nr:membrane dipeptidase [Brevundimonas sp.]MDI1280345.1 membrane dipeptidase [Brevundimonas sp.]
MSWMPNRRALVAASLVTALVPGGVRAAPVARGESASDDAFARLYRNAMVIDGNLVGPFDDTAALDPATAEQVRSSGLTAFKMTIGGSAGGYDEVNTDLTAFDTAISLSPDVYMKIRTADDLLLARRTSRVGVIYSFEAAEMLDGRLETIDHFSARGVRVMQLGYNTVSPFASGVMVPQPSSGLTALGHEAVARMNSLGVTLDLSHADERSTLGAISASVRPVAVTHAGCDAVHPHPRNKSDAVLKAVADSGGIVGIYGLSYISPGPAQQSLDDYLAHMIHALSVCGEDHVGIGSDALLTAFDTSADSMAQWDASIAARAAAGVAAPGEGRPPFVTGLNRPDRPALIARALLERGYPVRVVEKVLGANFQRVFAETWRA